MYLVFLSISITLSVSVWIRPFAFAYWSVQNLKTAFLSLLSTNCTERSQRWHSPSNMTIGYWKDNAIRTSSVIRQIFPSTSHLLSKASEPPHQNFSLVKDQPCILIYRWFRIPVCLLPVSFVLLCLRAWFHQKVLLLRQSKFSYWCEYPEEKKSRQKRLPGLSMGQ